MPAQFAKGCLKREAEEVSDGNFVGLPFFVEKAL
jgi:hypothetical protein